MSSYRHLTRAFSLSRTTLYRTDIAFKSISQTPHVHSRLSSSASSSSETPDSSKSPPTPRPKLTLHYPEPPTTAHNDLSSYLAYAARTGLSPKSTTYIGTHYEYTVAASLGRLGFDLRRIGGRDDGGIDLLGTWIVPALFTASSSSSSSSSSSPPSGHSAASEAEPEEVVDNGNKGTKIAITTTLRIILQCKAYTSKAGPQHVRELEGTFVAAPPGWRSNSIRSADDKNHTSGGVVGILVAQKPATKGVRDSLGRSQWPMAFISCSKDGKVEQLLWNRRAEEQGLEGVGVAVQHHGVGADGEKAQELVLTWQGLPYQGSIVEGAGERSV